MKKKFVASVTRLIKKSAYLEVFLTTVIHSSGMTLEKKL